MNDPFEKGFFKHIDNLDKKILNKTVIYCLRLKTNSRLPKKYQKILDKKKNRVIYIGKAERQTLANRLSQEFYHTSAGTFFRSIGAVLQFIPIPKHLGNKSNQKNYRFSKSDTESIITWLTNNVEICVANHSVGFDIEKYKPLLNHTHNPEKCQELIYDRKKCRLIAVNG